MTESEADGAPLEILDLGRRSYEDVYRLQGERLAARIRGAVPDGVFLVEHDPVVTRGRRSAEGDAAAVPFPVVTIERGGEATFHGPGQIVAYPILLLPEGRRDLHRYLRDLEDVVIQALAALGIEGRREKGLTGVWIGDKKVCSIGVAVRRWVTWHGLALNVTTDMDSFRSFAPCGLSADVMTRVMDHFPGGPEGKGPSGDLMAQVKLALGEALQRVFG
ncbi:Octanoyltransferase [Planctomycetes bacterium Poly30]|uniref:Octanoyltransferase n=1 Tax=Saltatorellus ferox TaxID=2528018 RepID=A0A518EPR5_9BACT|nr:Octanoyltransferase [Planctomycetes bacterium Poly30]